MASSDQRLKKDLNKLIPLEGGGSKPLGAASDKPPIGPKSSIGQETRKPRIPTSAGIASPLSETAYEDRVYYPDEIMYSADGLYAFVVRRLSQITMTDAAGNEVVFNFSEPVVTPPETP